MAARNAGDTEDRGRGAYLLVVVLISALFALIGVGAFFGTYVDDASGTAPPTSSTVSMRVIASPRASATGAKPQMNPLSIGAGVPPPPRASAISVTPEANSPDTAADGATSIAESAISVTPETNPPGSAADGATPTAESAVYGAEQQILPVKVSASAHAPPGFDSQGNRTTFEPQNAVDSQDATAWRVPGSGIGDFILLEFAAPTLVSSIGLIPGYAKTDPYDGTDRFSQNRRVRQVVIEFSDGAIARATFDDKREMQYKTLSVPIETTFIRITIAETTDHGGRDFAAISEIVVIGRERIQ